MQTKIQKAPARRNTSSNTDARDRRRRRFSQALVAPVSDERLRHLARHIHPLGERPLYELFTELNAGAPLSRTLERYARLYELRDFIAECGGRNLPQPRIVGGRR